jgi:hypothetical protein
LQHCQDQQQWEGQGLLWVLLAKQCRFHLRQEVLVGVGVVVVQ